jgi:hypothetical protein
MRTNEELKREYKETLIPMGVFMVRNTKTQGVMFGPGFNMGLKAVV